MTDDRELSLILDDWLAGGPSRMPDRVVGVVAAGIARQSQRPAWPPDWRSIRLTRATTVAMTAVAVAVAVAVGVTLGRFPVGPTAPAGPVATSGPTATSIAQPSRGASPSPIVGVTPRPTYGPLDPGTYASQRFALPFTYTVPSGWWLSADETTAFGLSWHDPEGTNGLEMLYNAYPPAVDANGCPDDARMTDWSRPHSARDLVDSLRRRSSMTTSADPTTIGGLAGWSVTVTVASDLDRSCDDGAIYVIHWSDGIPSGFGIGAGDTFSFTVLDSVIGGTILIKADGDDPTFLSEMPNIVQTFRFRAPDLPGTFSSQQFVPRVSYVLPAGWVTTEDSGTLLTIIGPSIDDSITVIANVFAPTTDDRGCETGINMSRDAAARLVTYWTTHPGVTSTKQAFSIGSLKGWLVVATRKPGWSPPCPTGQPTGPVEFYSLGHAHHSIGSVPSTLITLDTPDGQTIGIKVALDDTPALKDQAMKIIDTFQFDVAP